MPAIINFAGRGPFGSSFGSGGGGGATKVGSFEALIGSISYQKTGEKLFRRS
jgi:hypothetical protein